MSEEAVKTENSEIEEKPVLNEQGVPVADGQAEFEVKEQAEESAESTLEQQLVAAQDEAAKNLEGWQRTLAEFANARKRFDRQRADAYTNATVEVATKLLPIVDDFDRLIDNTPEAIADDDWFAGVQLVRRKLLGIFDHLKLEPIDALGQPFDPNLHDAIMQEPSEEHESGTVIAVFQNGYRMGDRVIRPAVVGVAA